MRIPFRGSYRPRPSSAPGPAEVARVLARLQARADARGFLRCQTPVLDGFVDPFGRMADADLPDGLVEVLGLSGFAHPRGLILGDATGFEHLLDSMQDTIAAEIHS